MLKMFKKKQKQTTYCYCPECNNELISSNSFLKDDGYVTYKCSKCGYVSVWSFDFPVPILIDWKDKDPELIK